MNEAAKRQAIADEARSWSRTPYHHAARIKGAGVDCAQLPAAIYEAVGLIPHLEPEYSPQWMMHRDEEQYLAWIRPYAREITRDQLAMGDLVVFKYGRTYSHSAIVLDLPNVIHAMNRDGRVIISDLDRDAAFIDRPALYFSLFGA